MVRDDPWHWLRERDDPRVLAHLQAENIRTETEMAACEDLQGDLFRELIGHIEESNTSAAYPEGDYIYESRIAKGQNYRAYYRKPANRPGDWELYFDANVAAGDNIYFDIGFLDVSPDGRLLAYAVDTVGEESYTLRFRDLTTGTDLPEVIEEVSSDGEWDDTGKIFYFVLEDHTRRPERIYRYIVGTDPATAEPVYEESDPRFFAGIYKSQDQQFLFAYSESKETTEVHYLRSDDHDGAFIPLFPRRELVQYWVEHHSGEWLVRTNLEAIDFELLAFPVDDPTNGQPRIVWAAQSGVRLENILPLKDFLLFFERTNGLDQIRVRSLRDNTEHLILLQDSVYDLQPSVNAEFETHFFLFTYSSPIRPSSTIRYNLDTREQEVIRSTKVPSGHNPDDYVVFRMQAPSHDGELVPMTVLHHRDLRRDGRNPAYLHGYGAYGDLVETEFRSSWLTWLQRGFVVAIAHVRGGGLLGEQWYQDGKFGKKENSFRDFIACAEMLIEQRYTAPRRIAIEGESAGGLLIGAVLNMRPDLFQAAVAAVPFVDVVNTMLDPKLPLTTIEYEEWGDPAQPGVLDTLMAYSPYENVRAADYPALLVTASYNDPRVPYWEAAKWVARLRSHHTGTSPILLKTHADTGHMGASGRYDYLREIALLQAFLLRYTTCPSIPKS